MSAMRESAPGFSVSRNGSAVSGQMMWVGRGAPSRAEGAQLQQAGKDAFALGNVPFGRLIDCRLNDADHRPVGSSFGCIITDNATHP
jgi:hypothetical protein